jgi:hypothetical protein
MFFIADLIDCSTCFGAPLCPSSGAREYYTVGCRLWSLVLGFQVVGMVWTWGLCCSQQTGHTTLRSTPYWQLENQAPKTTGGNQLYNTLELLMMGIMVPETCWASNKICDKKTSVASSWHFISTYGQSRIEYGTRQRSDLQYKFCRTKQKSVNKKGIKQNHSLSSNLKNVQFFRRKMKLFILQQTFCSVLFCVTISVLQFFIVWQ